MSTFSFKIPFNNRTISQVIEHIWTLNKNVTSETICFDGQRQSLLLQPLHKKVNLKTANPKSHEFGARA